jgi:hypothetical protein
LPCTLAIPPSISAIDDQLRICREKAEREKWAIVGTYKDAGISGVSMILRPGKRSASGVRQIKQRQVRA